MMKVNIRLVLLLLVSTVVYVDAGPLAYGICQAGCATLVVACYSAAGAVFGTVTAGVGTAPAIIACNSAFGTCSSACAAAVLAPTL